jgi:hypothetical protein
MNQQQTRTAAPGQNACNCDAGIRGQARSYDFIPSGLPTASPCNPVHAPPVGAGLPAKDGGKSALFRQCVGILYTSDGKGRIMLVLF